MDARIRAAATGLLVAATLVAMAPPALAVDQPPPTPPPPATVPASPAPPAAGQPTGGLPGQPGTPDGADPATTVPPEDPAVAEPPGETVPGTARAVPPPGGSYGGQPAFRPPEVLRSSVAAAETKLAAVEAARDDLIARLRDARHRRKQLGLQLDDLEADQEQVSARLGVARERLADRAVTGFVAEDVAAGQVVGTLDAIRYDRLMDIAVRRRLLDAAVDADEVDIDDLIALDAYLTTEVASTTDAIRWTDRSVAATETEARDATEAVGRAGDELEAFRAGSAIYIAGVVFPVARPYDLPLIDSWGFPRMPGTPDEHWHEGIDLFAPAGTPLVAAERGVVTRVGSGRLGGLTVWLRGESGTDWYYAHLQRHAPGLAEGQVVEAGDLLGYVGNTGNAASTPSHLHLEIHPGGGDPVDPYPLLKVVSDRDLASPDAGPDPVTANG